MADDAMFGLFDKVQDVLYLGTHGDLLRYLQYGILEAEVTCVDEAVCVHDVAQYALGHADTLQYRGIDAVVAGGIAAQDDVGGHILLHTASALHKRVTTHADVLLDDCAVALDGTVEQLALAGDDGADAYDAVVVDGHVVADVYLVHEEIAVADGGGLVLIGASRYHDVFTDAVVIAYHDMCLVALHVMEVLGCGADDRILIDNVVVAHAGAFENAGMGHDDAVVTDNSVLVDVSERLHLDICA